MAHTNRALAILWLAAIVPACATTTASDGADRSGGEGAGVGAPLPDLAMVDFDGKPLRPADLRGKVLLLDIWASWCAPCKEELPLLDKMAARLKSRGVEVLAVSIDENREDAVRFLKDHGGEWSLQLAHDPEARVADRLKPSKMPTSYVVDRKGIVRHVNAGFQRSDVAALEAKLSALAEK